MDKVRTLEEIRVIIRYKVLMVAFRGCTPVTVMVGGLGLGWVWGGGRGGGGGGGGGLGGARGGGGGWGWGWAAGGGGGRGGCGCGCGVVGWVGWVWGVVCRRLLCCWTRSIIIRHSLQIRKCSF